MKARSIAYECLKKVIIEKDYANLVMRNALEQANDKDKGLITQIVYGTLRNYRLCRFQWEYLAKQKVNEKTAILLDMSVYQYFMMDKIPTYAIVDEAVDLVPQAMKGFVNAILRKVFQQELREVDDISVMTSHPEWLVKLWTAHYGEDVARKICESDLEDASIVARINTLKASKEELEEIEGIQFLDDFALSANFNLVQSQLFEEGKIIIQDGSSQKVAEMLELYEGLDVLDCCSAPGTKTSQIAMILKNTGHILAGELHEHRVQLVSQLMTKMGVTNTEVIQMDATRVDEYIENRLFDRILMDVPCSGLGVLKRKPDIKLRCSPANIDEICEIQRKIMESCSKLLKLQGIFVYSTCTLNKKENEKQVQHFLVNNPNFICIEQKTIFPFEDSGDGFYMAKMIKIK